MANEYRAELDEIKENIAQISKVSSEYESYLKAKAIRIRDIIICILLFFFITSNVIWAIYESQFETVKETTETVTTTTIEDVEQSADNGGNNNIVGGDYYGKAKD